MDKETLSHYGWIVILVLILAVMLALASPFGSFIASAIKSTTAGLFSVNQAALGSAGIDVNDMVFENCDHLETEIRNATDTYTGDICCKACGAVLQAGQTVRPKVPEGATYTTADGTTYNAGDEMPENCINGDVYTTVDYKYTFKEEQDGWHVKAIGSKASYGYILNTINGKPITDMTQTYAYIYKDIVLPSDFTIPDTVTIMSQTFRSCDITILPNTLVIPEGVTDLSETFKASDITNAPIIPNGVTNLSETFASCAKLKTYIGSTDQDGDFSNYVIPDTVENLYQMFYSCRLVEKAPALPARAKNVTNMFYGCTSLADISKIVIPSTVSSMYGMFRTCHALEDASSLVIPSHVTSVSECFDNCKSLKKLPDISQMGASDMYKMFSYCTAITDLSSLVIPSSVTKLSYTFKGCSALTTAPVIPSSVTSMYGTFSDCTHLEKAPVISNNVKDIRELFMNCNNITGTVTINYNSSNYANYTSCFAGVDFEAQNLTLTGNDEYHLDDIGATGTNYCAECNGKCNGGH